MVRPFLAEGPYNSAGWQSGLISKQSRFEPPVILYGGGVEALRDRGQRFEPGSGDDRHSCWDQLGCEGKVADARGPRSATGVSGAAVSRHYDRPDPSHRRVRKEL